MAPDPPPRPETAPGTARCPGPGGRPAAAWSQEAPGRELAPRARVWCVPVRASNSIFAAPDLVFPGPHRGSSCFFLNSFCWGRGIIIIFGGCHNLLEKFPGLGKCNNNPADFWRKCPLPGFLQGRLCPPAAAGTSSRSGDPFPCPGPSPLLGLSRLAP